MGFSKPCQLNEWQAQKGCQLKQQQFPQAVSRGYDTQTTFGAKVDGQFSQRLWPTVFFHDTLLPYSPLCYRHWFCLSCQSHPCWGQYCLALFPWIVVIASGKKKKEKKKCTQHKQTNEKTKGEKQHLRIFFFFFFFAISKLLVEKVQCLCWLFFSAGGVIRHTGHLNHRGSWAIVLLQSKSVSNGVETKARKCNKHAACLKSGREMSRQKEACALWTVACREHSFQWPLLFAD